jgi:argininosuccinate lyase
MPLRDGRFERSLDEAMRRLNASIPFDRRLHAEDIRGSVAWARALRRAGLLDDAELGRIEKGLEEIAGEIRGGSFPFSEELEDVHMNIEARLTEKIGAAGEKLHTGRSRNDQVATDLRLHAREAATRLAALVEALMGALVEVAEREFGQVIPAYTHLQRAQPVLLSHHLLAYVEMLDRDTRRLRAARDAADLCPLGSGACVGNQFGIDRDFLARELGFAGVTRNSLDAVSDRDFALDFLHAAAVLMVHLSRLAEDLVLWSSAEFGLARLDDSVTTGSSMLPQKRNPDAAELARGKCGRVAGHLVGLLMTLKGLPLSYNKDLQEDKEPVFDAIDTLDLLLPVFAAMVRTMAIDSRRTAERLEGGFLEAIAAADYLTRRGVPFREAHRIAGRAVREAEKRGVTLAALPLEAYRALCDRFEEDLFEAISTDGALADKTVVGGTAPARVWEEIGRWKVELGRRGGGRSAAGG